MMFERDFSFFNNPMTRRYDSPFGFNPRQVRQDNPFWNSQQRRRVPRQGCQCGNCDQGSSNRYPRGPSDPVQPTNRKFGRGGRTILDEDHIEIPVNITNENSKSTKSSQTKPKINLNSLQRPKNNRPKKTNESSKSKSATKVEKEKIITNDGAKEQPQKLNVGDRSNLTKEEPILVQLSTPEIKNIDFDPFQADEEIEIPPCL